MWRTRLDATTNWAVITAAAALTFTFNSPSRPYVVLLVILLVLIFSASRRGATATTSVAHRCADGEPISTPACSSSLRPSEEWPPPADSLLHPSSPISAWEASPALPPNYMWVFAILGVSWWMKDVRPRRHGSLRRRSDGPPSAHPGPVVVGIGLAFYALLS